MRCEECAQALGGYLDGELAAAVVVAFEAHLRVCKPCGGLVASCRKTIEIYRSHNGKCAAAPLPPALHRKLVMPPSERERHPRS